MFHLQLATSTHDKAVVCFTDPYFMSGTDLSVEEIPVDLCTDIVVETRFINNTFSNFEDFDTSTAPSQSTFNDRYCPKKVKKIYYVYFGG